MDTNVKELKNSEFEIEIELNKDEFKKYMDAAAKEISIPVFQILPKALTKKRDPSSPEEDEGWV